MSTSLFSQLANAQMEIERKRMNESVHVDSAQADDVSLELYDELEDTNESLEDINSIEDTDLMGLDEGASEDYSLEETEYSLCPECGEIVSSNTCDCGADLTEAVKMVVRNGKVVRKKTKRKQRMSAAQKQALAKARKKAHSKSANKTRAKSMKVRKKKIHEEEEYVCPECDYVGPMSYDDSEEGYICPECGAILEIADEACNGGKTDCNESEEPITEKLKLYVETLSVPQEIVDEGAKAIKAYLIKEYGIFCKED